MQEASKKYIATKASATDSADREQAVVAQHQEALVAQVAHEARPLVVVERHALVVVVGERGEHEDRVLRQGEQALGLRGDGDAVDAVHVQHALRVRARGVHGAVDGEPGRVDLVGAFEHLAALEVDLDEARGRDLLEEHPVRVDEEVVLRPRHPRRDVREDEVVPAEAGDEAVAGGEVDAPCPLLRADGGADAAGRFVHGASPGGHRSAII